MNVLVIYAAMIAVVVSVTFIGVSAMKKGERTVLQRQAAYARSGATLRDLASERYFYGDAK